MKLNKFLKNKINYQYMPDMTDSELANADFDADGIPSGGIASTGTGVTTNAPISLSMQQIRNQIDALNAQLATRTETGPELEALKRQAYAEFLAFALANDGVNFTKEDFADALTISVEDAERDYYNFDFTDVEPLDLTYNNQVTAATGTTSTSRDTSIGTSVLGADRSWTPQAITAEDVSVPTAYGLMDAATLEKYLPADMTRRVNEVTQNTPAYSAGSTLPAGLFDAINFPAQTINRGVPVVTKGLDAQGNPTTGITMGNAAATPSGANIGQLDISTLLPSTGMGINADGSGTATVGTLDTTGNIIGSSADTLNMFDTGMGNTSTIDPNFIGLSGTGGTTGGTTGGNVTPVVPPVVPPVVVPPALSQAQVIQNLFNTSQTKDIAAQRIGDYAASVGGITAEDIAAAVTPILSGTMESPNRFGMAPVGSDGAAQVMGAVEEFGYGQMLGGPDVASFITENPMIASTAQPVELSPAEQLAKNNARLQYLNTQDSAIGTGEYTEQEAAMRGLDFAKRQGMTLAQAGAGFGLDEAGVRDQADKLGIDLASLGFNQGGSVNSQDRSPVELRQDAVGSRLMRQTGLASLQGATMSPEMASTLDRIMARSK
jgi:hypothetical protein